MINENTQEFAFAKITFEGKKFWPGRTRIYCEEKSFKRTITIIEKNKSIFSDLNEEFKHEIFGTINLNCLSPEIWWFYPRGKSKKCDSAIFYAPDNNTIFFPPFYNFSDLKITLEETKKTDFWENIQEELSLGLKEQLNYTRELVNFECYLKKKYLLTKKSLEPTLKEKIEEELKSLKLEINNSLS